MWTTGAAMMILCLVAHRTPSSSLVSDLGNDLAPVLDCEPIRPWACIGRCMQPCPVARCIVPTLPPVQGRKISPVGRNPEDHATGAPRVPFQRAPEGCLKLLQLTLRGGTDCLGHADSSSKAFHGVIADNRTLREEVELSAASNVPLD